MQEHESARMDIVGNGDDDDETDYHMTTEHGIPRGYERQSKWYWSTRSISTEPPERHGAATVGVQRH
jgi:hypothetical protein